MRQASTAILPVVLGLGLCGLVAGAQNPQEPPSGGTAEETQPYFSPPAWKSVEIGNYYWQRKKVNAALSRYQEAVKTDPHYAPAYLGLGRVYEKIGLKKKAVEAYQRYLDELPSTKDAIEAKGAQKAVARLEKELKLGEHSRMKSSPASPPSPSH